MKNGFLLVGFGLLLSACGGGQLPGFTYFVSVSCPTMMFVGQSGMCTAIIKDAAGKTISPQPNYVFRSSNPAVASVSDKGVIKALAVGLVGIAAVTIADDRSLSVVESVMVQVTTSPGTFQIK